MVEVFYQGDPYQLPLRFVEDAGDGWCLLQWPVGEGFTALDGSVKDGPFRHYREQIRETPFFKPNHQPNKKYLRRRVFA